ncbi:MAG: glycosylase [Lachnospiraceae bacterium]|nr:glycosylase [Lachnospiraceae bacterium]
MNWKKLGVIYDPTKDPLRPDWRYDYAQGVNTLEFKEYLRIYFCCREKPDAKGRTVSRVSYVDVEKENPKKIIRVADHPVLELGGLGEFDEFGTYPFSVIRAEEKVLGFYGGITRCESVPFNAAVGLCVSEDEGEHFEKIGKGPVLSYSYDEPFVVGSPKIRYFNDQYILTYSAGRVWTVKEGRRPEICYKLRMATSADAIHWKKRHVDLIPNKLGAYESQACGDILYKNGTYHMFFCYRNHENFRRDSKNSYRIGYAVSSDLMDWRRIDDAVGIDVSDNGWDSEMVAYPHVFEAAGKIYMLYLGNEVGKYGFGIAELEGALG